MWIPHYGRSARYVGIYNNTGKYENLFIKTGNNLNKPFVANFQAKVGQQETVA